MANLNCNGKIESKQVFTENLYINGKIFLDNIFPVGTIYFSVNENSPAEIFGGTWALLSGGKSIWTTTENGSGGQVVQAGIPNITGDATLSSGRWDTIEYSGFVSAPSEYIVSGGHTGNSYRQRGFRVNFDASRSSSIYGGSETVQPPAIKVFAWERLS